MRAELSPEQIDYFLTGTDFAFFWDEPERGDDWRAAREEILADWLRERPGARPWAWWKYDAPEPRRRRVGGRGDLIPAYDADTNLRFGIFRRSAFVCESLRQAWADGGRFQIFDESDPPRYESQADYLKRHGLFLPGEERRIPEKAWEPEVVR